VNGHEKSVESCFFVVGKIGAGRTSNVFQALDEKGSPWVIKMYMKRTQDTGTQDTGTQDTGTQDTGTQDTGSNLSAKQFKQKALEQTTKEVKNLQTLYPFLADKVRHKKIVGHHCVITLSSNL
jgi:serine/threonine-protein kinase RIO1